MPRRRRPIRPRPTCLALCLAAAASPCTAAHAQAGHTNVYNFSDARPGVTPFEGDLLLAPDGALYGAANDTRTGRQQGETQGHGAIYRFVPPAAGRPASYFPIYVFNGASGGSNPQGGLTSGPGNVLYGTTRQGGAGHHGTVFKLTPPKDGAGRWAQEVLYQFGAAADGAYPSGTLLLAPDGALYGTTAGDNRPEVDLPGTAFRLQPPAKAGGPWTETILHVFATAEIGADGFNPAGGVVAGGSGQLIGMTNEGGQYGIGTVYRLTPPSGKAGSWTEDLLTDFPPDKNHVPVDGSYPNSEPVVDAAGNIYGATSSGGSPTYQGAVFQLRPPATPGAAWDLAILYRLSQATEANAPEGPLLLGQDGTLTGTAQGGGECPGEGAHSGHGVVYRLTPPTQAGLSWTYGNLSIFGCTLVDGSGLFGNVTADRTGTLFVTAPEGGTASAGTIARLDP